jgi:hypothetical protein
MVNLKKRTGLKTGRQESKKTLRPKARNRETKIVFMRLR